MANTKRCSVVPVLTKVLLISLLTVNLPVGAAQKGDSVMVMFTGVLKRKPCQISNDQPISVHFGKMGVHKVDGTNYRQPIPYTLKCDEDEPGLILNLTVRGNFVGYDIAALATSARGLGIHIEQNGELMPINKPLPISYSNPPTLTAVPVQLPGGELPEGDFRATATLMAEYE